MTSLQPPIPTFHWLWHLKFGQWQSRQLTANLEQKSEACADNHRSDYTLGNVFSIHIRTCSTAAMG